MTTPHENPALCKVAMFLAGFIMLTPHRIAMTCAPHVLKRYHLPPEVVGLFIYKIHNPMELSNLFTMFFANLVTWMNDDTFKYKILNRALSILGVWLMFISSVISFIIFKSGGDFGYFDKFYWSIIFISFTNGIFSNLCFGVNYNSSLYGAGVPSSGFFTFFLHKYCKWLSVRFDWEDFDHSILMIQFWVTIITLGITAILWSVDIGMDFGDNANERGNQGILRLFTTYAVTADLGNADKISHICDWSPIGMLAASLGTVYFFYPSISPYQLVDSDVGKKIDLWVQFTAAIPNFAVALLDLIGEEVGPSGKSWTVTESWYWQLSWMAIIPYLTCIYIFLSFMHYPEGFFGKHMKSKKWVVYIVCITFNFFQEWLESIGFAGAGAQIQDNAEEGTGKPFDVGGQRTGKINFAAGAFNDDIAVFNVLLTITIVNISIIIGYLIRNIRESFCDA